MKLKVINYTKIIKNKVILDNVNLELESGNIYGFFGRNGSGKTMLFRALTSLIHPTEGDVLIDGKSVNHDDFDLSQVGILIEDPGFYPHLTGFENLEMLYTINNKKDSDYIKSVLDRVGLLDAAFKKYKEYSLGMRQRLRIAQAFMENQKIIILDEPTNGLDEKGIEIIYNLIQEEKNKGKLILLASHNKEDLKMLCDKIYSVREGKIEEALKEEVSLW